MPQRVQVQICYGIYLLFSEVVDIRDVAGALHIWHPDRLAAIFAPGQWERVLLDEHIMETQK